MDGRGNISFAFSVVFRYSTSQSDVSKTTFERPVYQATGVRWKAKFVRLAETS